MEIKGLKFEQMEKLLALPERRKEIDSLLTGIYKTINGDFFSEKARKNREEKYKSAKESLLNGLKTIGNLASEAEKLAKTSATRCKLGHLGKTELEKTLEKLNTANNAINNSEVKEIAGFLLPDTASWEAEIAESTQDPLLKHLEYSSRLYRALAEAAEFNLKILS
jgi:hypothetical protein